MESKPRNPRPYLGYADQPPVVDWPGRARLALQFVLNYEEGGENCVLHGDPHAETFLSDIAGAEAYPDRHMSMESLYEYGSRVGVWRILNEFAARQLPLTIFGIATALQRNPRLVDRIQSAGYDICCHGWKWLHYQKTPVAEERQDMQNALKLITELTGEPPQGWYTGRDSPNTRALVTEHDQLIYDSDYYGDDLPFWMLVDRLDGSQKPHLIVPYTLDNNDMRFFSPYGFTQGEDFFQYLKASFDCLYREGATHPKMMSVGLHCRGISRPGRFIGLQKFLDYIQQFPDVWVTRRLDIARFWRQQYPYSAA